MIYNVVCTIFALIHYNYVGNLKILLNYDTEIVVFFNTKKNYNLQNNLIRVKNKFIHFPHLYLYVLPITYYIHLFPGACYSKMLQKNPTST